MTSEAGITVSRRVAYGSDQLFVFAHGADVGWWDLARNEPHPSSAAQLQILVGTVTQWLGARADRQLDSSSERTAGNAAEQGSVVPTAAPLEDSEAGAETRAKTPRVINTPADRSWQVGSLGEERTARQLAVLSRIDSRWRSVHNVAVGRTGWDIDHLVVGPGGVFTINTKHHPRADVWVGGQTFLVRGMRKPYLRKSFAEAKRVGELLSTAAGRAMTVMGMIALVDPSNFADRGPRFDGTSHRIRLGDGRAGHETSRGGWLADRSTANAVKESVPCHLGSGRTLLDLASLTIGVCPTPAKRTLQLQVQRPQNERDAAGHWKTNVPAEFN